MRPDARARRGGLEASVPLPLARADVREAQRRRVSVLPELHAGRSTRLANVRTTPLERIWNGERMQRMRRLHATGRAGEIDICSRCCTTIPHPVLVAGSLVFHGRWVRKALPAGGTPRLLLETARPAAAPPAEGAATKPAELVQIEPRYAARYLNVVSIPVRLRIANCPRSRSGVLKSFSTPEPRNSSPGGTIDPGVAVLAGARSE